MEKFFNVGFVALILAGIARYFISSNAGVEITDIGSFEDWEMWLYGISILWFMLAFWNVLIRRRCPQCRSSKYSCNGSEEIDRWVGTKKVREKVGDNQFASKNVTTTFVKIKSFFGCLQCEHNWTEIVKQEKTG